MALSIAKAAALFFVVAILQVTIVASIGILGGSPDLVLVTLVAVALTQGSIFGAVTGFWAGLLIDVARLGTLGFTSLLLTLAGFWIGRYGETTGRDRAQRHRCDPPLWRQQLPGVRGPPSGRPRRLAARGPAAAGGVEGLNVSTAA